MNQLSGDSGKSLRVSERSNNQRGCDTCHANKMLFCYYLIIVWYFKTTCKYVAVFIVLHTHAFALSCSYNYVLMNVTDLMEMDYMFTKVMLYMSPHKNLYVVLQIVDPILATSFYIWYIETYKKELLTKANKDKDLVAVHKTVFILG